VALSDLPSTGRVPAGSLSTTESTSKHVDAGQDNRRDPHKTFPECGAVENEDEYENVCWERHRYFDSQRRSPETSLPPITGFKSNDM
jgi:hypothetical protein